MVRCGSPDQKVAFRDPPPLAGTQRLTDRATTRSTLPRAITAPIASTSEHGDSAVDEHANLRSRAHPAVLRYRRPGAVIDGLLRSWTSTASWPASRRRLGPTPPGGSIPMLVSPGVTGAPAPAPGARPPNEPKSAFVAPGYADTWRCRYDRAGPRHVTRPSATLARQRLQQVPGEQRMIVHWAVVGARWFPSADVITRRLLRATLAMDRRTAIAAAAGG
jgi:hypothetical protein